MTSEELTKYFEKYTFDECLEIYTSFDKNIYKPLKESDKFKLCKPNIKIEDGVYITIRIAIDGRIYQILNTYQNGMWMTNACDGSYTIAYKELTIEELNKNNKWK